MASPDIINQQQQTFVPYDATKDCSQGFCTIHCPQWCYSIFLPPPPPFSFIDDENGSPTNKIFSPLVIAIIGILSGALLLILYYTIISKYCNGFRFRRHRPNNPIVGNDVGNNQSRPDEAWHVFNGLDEALINKISVYRYKKGDGLVDVSDCSVCLGDFREDDSLRLLPKCSHAFHLHCIDTWLRSHSNCPLCRANIVSVNPPESDPGQNDSVVVVEDSEEEGTDSEENCEMVEIRDDVNGSMFSSQHRDQGVSIGSGSSSRGQGESSGISDRSRSSHRMIVPVPMKRERVVLARKEKERDSVRPM